MKRLLESWLMLMFCERRVMRSLWLFLAVALPASGADFATISPSGKTRIEWTYNQDLGWSIVVFRDGKNPVEVPFEIPENRFETLGISNFPERKLRWVSERYCVTTISYGFGILDTEMPKWVCNTDVNWGFANIRKTIAYVVFRPGRGDSKPGNHDNIGVYRFGSSGTSFWHDVYPLAGFIVSPIFESRYCDQVAFIQQLPNKQKQLVIFATEKGKSLATRTLPKRFSNGQRLWWDEDGKEGRAKNRELLQWIESSTRYGPFWEPAADRF